MVVADRDIEASVGVGVLQLDLLGAVRIEFRPEVGAAVTAVVLFDHGGLAVRVADGPVRPAVEVDVLLPAHRHTGLEFDGGVGLPVEVVVIPLQLGNAGLEIDPLVGAAVGIGVAFLGDGPGVRPEAHPGVEIAVVVGVLLGAGWLALAVVDELVVAAISVGVGLLLLELLFFVEEQYDRALGLRQRSVRPEQREEGQDGQQQAGVSSSQRSDCGRWP